MKITEGKKALALWI